ncbi:Hypothetical_protein [Hexamita inflata]|uniref:Hypothetical_protein n=1 Tax=Hexamita inflata TaxID=28002 RepID=A0AA86PKN8_9EUKA|nr:Hypothetical protein HINF_LOCUS27853 [Hexamita inflata]
MICLTSCKIILLITIILLLSQNVFFYLIEVGITNDKFQGYLNQQRCNDQNEYTAISTYNLDIMFQNQEIWCDLIISLNFLLYPTIHTFIMTLVFYTHNVPRFYLLNYKLLQFTIVISDWNGINYYNYKQNLQLQQTEILQKYLYKFSLQFLIQRRFNLFQLELTVKRKQQFTCLTFQNKTI